MTNKFRICKIELNVKRDFNDDSKLRQADAKVFEFYAYNPAWQVYCCSITPSIWIEYIGNYFELPADHALNDEEVEELHDELIELTAFGDPSGYVAARAFDNIASIACSYELDAKADDFESEREFEQKAYDEIRDAWAANPHFF